MGDHLWTGKPPRRRTRHAGLLSLSHSSLCQQYEFPAKDGEYTGTLLDTHIARIQDLAAFAGVCLAEWTSLTGVSTGSGSAIEACWRRCAIQIHISFTLLSLTGRTSVWRFGLVVTLGLDQRSCVTLDPVSTWMGDRLCMTSKPSLTDGPTPAINDARSYIHLYETSL